MTEKILRILLAEDDELFRLGSKMRLQQESGLEIAAEAEDGETAVELVKQYPLDLVLLDVGLPGSGGIEACRQIKQAVPDLPILVLTSHSKAHLIARLIIAGAQGYCLKGIPAEKLILAVRSVAAGASWWDQTATTAIQAAFQPENSGSVKADQPVEATSTNSLTPHSNPLENPLTPREQEILRLIALGKSNHEIAELLYITSGTVRVHVHAILQKLEVRDRTQAAVLAIQKHLVNVGSSPLK
ncbi:response regulator [Myxacorys almedinensis]|uniref:Response regulator n=1 Tax=Myxacorys almedinensis A TaxID=2690445 RepID=A0A8J7Z6W3_9CYAN|nr:response regulator transcription factor [Myxacorys almedinensis]NDJ19016.1 response regulator [Myxacorys almedinensis A]